MPSSKARLYANSILNNLAVNIGGMILMVDIMKNINYKKGCSVSCSKLAMPGIE